MKLELSALFGSSGAVLTFTHLFYFCFAPPEQYSLMPNI